MESSLREIEKLIDQKIQEGIFHSPAHALQLFREWVEQLERNLVYEQMRNEDA
ncbi:MAG: hypothetical protein P8Y92_10350 [Halioglobus sp.]|jgi:hypothetical protein